MEPLTVVGAILRVNERAAHPDNDNDLFGRRVVVVVFFTLTDRASTIISSNIRGCQSGTTVRGVLDRRSEENIYKAGVVCSHLLGPSYSSTCPLHTNSGCGEERRILIGPW